ncbi:MAG: tRNA lysidine(34) synthetase TilS [Candidatus Deferrimicrobiaceae bacterium]
MPAGPGSGKESNDRTVVAGVSGGPDSVYLLWKFAAGRKWTRVIAGHVNYGTRGRDSLKDQALVEHICKGFGIEKDILAVNSDRFPGGRQGSNGRFPAGFEKKARDARYRFLRGLSEKMGADAIALAHTADDQVETILMRVFEGAGIGGLKGIPRETKDGIVRPILDVWKEDILNDLKKHKIPYRIDRSNFDTRFERNWIRHVLVPLLVKRYGKTVKKRIFTLGERFRELDEYIDAEARRWANRNITMSTGSRGETRRRGGVKKVVVSGTSTFPPLSSCLSFRRQRYSALPSVLRVRILQRNCFDRLGVAPNERLLKAMDRNIREGGPSARVKVGKGWCLVNRYEHATFLQAHFGGSGKASKAAQQLELELKAPGEYEIAVGPGGGGTTFLWNTKGKVSPAQAKRLAASGDAEVFDAATLRMPLTVRPLRAGDRIRPFGRDAGGNGRAAGRNCRDADKRVKEILIDRKVPRDARWGRPVVCDAEGAILWIPGVLRSAHAPVTPASRKAVLLRVRASK